MPVHYAIHLLASADAAAATAFPGVSGDFVPRKGDTVLLPVTASDTAVCLVTDVFLSVERDGVGSFSHASTVVEVVRDPALNVVPAAPEEPPSAR